MSTDLTAFQANLPADILEQMRIQTELERARMGSVSERDVIRITQDKKFQLPSGDLVDEFDAVIVNFAYRNNYYLGRYNPKDPTPPACFAISDDAKLLEPSANSPMVQSDDCASCQHNQYGSSPTGNGKACKNTVMIAVVPADDQANHPIWVVQTSPTAITAFNKYVKHVMDTVKYPAQSVVTRFFLDPKETYATLRFEIVNPNLEVAVAFGRKEEAMRRLLQEPDVSSFKSPASK